MARWWAAQQMCLLAGLDWLHAPAAVQVAHECMHPLLQYACRLQHGRDQAGAVCGLPRDQHLLPQHPGCVGCMQALPDPGHASVPPGCLLPLPLLRLVAAVRLACWPETRLLHVQECRLAS